MSKPIIRVNNLSKRYRIGAKEKGCKTFRETIIEGISAPVRNLAKLRSLTKFRKGDEKDVIWALKNVSFEVKKGEVLGIIGRNGAGKTTLLKVLSRITEPTSGFAEIHGRVSSLLQVGTGFHPELTGRENIFLNGAILGMRKREIEKKFDEIVAFAEIEKFLDTPVKRYSSGMDVRLAFSIAAHLEPEILLVDEVLAVGDVAFQKKCLGKMGEVAKEGRTILYVSHNMPSIVNLCQRAILLSKGKIVSDGKSAEVVQRYLTTVRSLDGEVIWPDPTQAPGNDIVRLHAVRILQDGTDGSTADVDISKEVLIQIDYWCLQEGAPLYSSIWLRDRVGTPVLSSDNAKSVSLTKDPWYGRPHPRGLFQSVCRIPGNFLNDGLYSVTVILGKVPNDTLVLEDYVVSFRVHDTGEMRKEYLGHWIGTVRPRLAWHTKYIGPGEDTIGGGT